ncbi:hypothetical protein D3C73_1335590 [compost metagenome]
MAFGGPSAGRHLQTQSPQRSITALQAETRPGGAFVAERGLGKHGVFFQVGQLRLEQFAGHGQQVAVAFGQDAEARLHAPLDHAAGAQARVLGAEVVDVAGQLALQKLAGVGAADGEDALVGQGAVESGIGHGGSRWLKTGGHHRTPVTK